MENGWIKIHRKLRKKGYYKNSFYVHLWVHLLMLASHEDTEFFWNGNTQKLIPGQFVTGRKAISKETGISMTTIERILDVFVNEGQIGQQKTTKHRLITILNWENYQQTDNRRTTDGQQTDNRRTHSRSKELKKVKNNTLSQSDETFSFKDQMSKMKTDPDTRMLIIAYYWYFKKWNFENRKQYDAALKRELRPATSLQGFKIKDIAKAMDYCAKEYPTWSLETAFKRITDIANET